MKLIRFLLNKIFYRQLLIMGLVTLVLLGVLNFALSRITLHNKHQIVPDLKGITLTDLPQILLEKNLRYEILDSSRYVPDIPPLSVISHLPGAGSEVKKNRKIYLTVNPSGYGKITVPNLIQITKRNAESMIKAVGFELGNITYIDNIGKDMVLEIRYRGKTIPPGALLPKMSKIDLVLGNGKR